MRKLVEDPCSGKLNVHLAGGWFGGAQTLVFLEGATDGAGPVSTTA